MQMDIKQLISIVVFTTTALIFFLPFHGFCAESDRIISGEFLKDPQTITSNNTLIKLGFFTVQNTTNRYLAIFHVFSPGEVLWIANRNKPLKDSSGRVSISERGNLVLTDGDGDILWSTNITTKFPANVGAQIQDNGNLVLYENSTDFVRWDTFSHPAHVWIPANKLVDDTNTGFRVRLSSWKNESDPEIGEYTTGLQGLRIPEIFIWKNERPYYRAGPWNGQIFIGMAALYKTAYSNGLRVTEMSPGNFYLSAAQDRFFTKYTIHPSGKVEKTLWNDQKKAWDRMWSVPSNDCDVYGNCGSFGICDLRKPQNRLCSCLRGFVPADKEEWGRGNWTKGCVRRTQLQCSNNGGGGGGDGFLRTRFVKVPDFAESFPSSQLKECREMCLRNCSCLAYAHDQSKIGCMIWSEKYGELVDTQQFPDVGVDLYIRVAKSEIDKARERKLLVILLPAIGGSVLILSLIFFAWRWMVKRKAGGRNNRDEISNGEDSSLFSRGPIIAVPDEQYKTVQTEDLTLFAFEILARATNSFDERNMLGKGGFGHVYKGILQNGKEIAVKRLSEASGQGKGEFMNEMVVISRLQHRNLVRLIGCCVEKDEKMLVYEYMPNKSLDICLLDGASPQLKNWKTRFNIIEGIGRGLLYLHRDSRLRIIHRDLKPSNVLLDDEWNPKISDFGMARIFETNQDQENTARVVGTYGYMAPEYALEGRYSEKSDVYSFGVLMLEIISGKKNTHYKNDESPMSILGCAWELWKEGNGSSFVDDNLAPSENEVGEIVRCIQIALLCVQEFANERPTIQNVLSMLSREIVDVPVPEKPVFPEMSANSSGQVGYSINQITATVLYGR